MLWQIETILSFVLAPGPNASQPVSQSASQPAISQLARITHPKAFTFQWTKASDRAPREKRMPHIVK